MQTYALLAILMLATLSACTEDRSTTSPSKGSSYTEAQRPQFHFSPDSMWMNDPNGLVYFDGEYHLFYQYYPDSTVWGPMHWGHAVSTDLIHWKHLPIAIYPDQHGWIFSGSVVVDHHNTSGLGKNGQVPLVAIFTQHNADQEKAGRNDFQNQSIAYSLDKGRTWTMYPGNPVLKSPNIRDFRDPKVSWYEPTKRWIMPLAVQDHIAFYSSPDLIHWTHESDFGQQSGAHGGVWECPDLFPLRVPGSTEQKWVLLVSMNPGGPNGGSATQYFIGDFDGKTFHNDNPAQTTLWMDYGRDNYAGVTWSNLPKQDGRRLLIGWMSNWDYAQVVPTQRWRSANTLPRVLSLGETPQGLRLYSNPVAEVRRLRQTETRLRPAPIERMAPLSFDSGLMEAIIELDLGPNLDAQVGLELSNAKGERYQVGFDAATGAYFSDRTKAGQQDFSPVFAKAIHRAPRWSKGNTIRLHLFVDHSAAELFADQGATVLTDIFFPSSPFVRAKFFASKPGVQVKAARFYELQSIWK